MSRQTVISEHDEIHYSYGKYAGGFVSSVALTLIAYWLVTHGSASKNVLVAVLAVLAITQFIVQMVLFLHIGEERGTRWKLITAGMMLTVVLILVVGSIWIMNNLNYRMTPKQIMQYMQSQDNL
jgi:cytochrome o ubiquinol oxidase operon protein cyoD